MAPATVPFVGRERELAVLRAALARAASGEPQVMFIEGAPGIGKTALVGRLVDAYGPMPVLAATGDETEVSTALGVVDQLLRAAGATPPWARGGEALPDPVSVGVELLGQLGRLQQGAPVLVVLDDAQWADLPSLRAVLFMLRRLREDAVLTLIVARTGAAEALPEGLVKLAGEQRLELGALRVSEVRELATAAGAALSADGAARLHAHALGAPLHVRALLREFPAGAWERADRLPPASRSFAARVAGVLERSSPDARALLEAASLLGMRWELATAAQVGGVEDPVEALDQAVRSDLVHVESAEPGPTFAHPLVRSAIYHGLRPARAAALHRAAAGVMPDEASVLRHLAAAASGPDADLAARLDGFAARRARRGAWEPAAAAWFEASRLAPTPQLAERRLLDGIDALLHAGRRAEATARLRALPPGSGALRALVLAHAALVGGDVEAAREHLDRAWELCALAHDRAVAARVAQRHAHLAVMAAEMAEAVTWAWRADALVAQDPMTAWPLAMGLAHAGELVQARAVLDEALAHSGGEATAVGPLLGAHRGWLMLQADEIAAARHALAASGPAAQEVGSISLAATAYSWLALADHAAGEWDVAARHAERALALAETAGEGPLELANIAALRVAIDRGDHEASAARVAAVERSSTGSRAAWLAAASARARLAAALGDPERVLTVLEPILAEPRFARFSDPVVADWPLLYAEALLGLDRHDEAERVLRRHEACAAEGGRRSTIARCARVWGRLELARGRGPEAEAALRRALDSFGNLGMPYELALTQLTLGQLLRRGRRRRAAVQALQAAREGFAALRARPALERCERELVASGLTPVRRTERDASRLTPQEDTVARLAASGLSNRQIATELLLSVRTVEVHLTRVYAKLGIGSRTELARAL